jgi:membrane associated rhomboid family serine protease
MRIQLRHFLVALLPLVFGLAASWSFAFSQNKCGRLVGPVFAPKCHWIQLEYQLGFLMAGTLLGCIIAAVVGATLERRSRRRVTQAANLNQEVHS